MKKLNRSEMVAVGVALAFLTYLLFSGPIINFFYAPMNNTEQSSIPSTGFVSEEIAIGSGQLAESGDVVSAHYVGRLLSGEVFDSSRERGEPIKFTLGVGQVIRGWDEGLLGMREGGRRVITIAPDYGYGSNAVGSIPANSTLVFEVEIVSVEKPAVN